MAAAVGGAARGAGGAAGGPRPGNPLVLLGELDRVDETAAHALLGVIDPVRHGAFLDRYVGLPLGYWSTRR